MAVPADDERARRWAHDIRADLRPWATSDVYLNFIGDEGHDRLVAGFGRGNYDRLAAVKPPGTRTTSSGSTTTSSHADRSAHASTTAASQALPMSSPATSSISTDSPTA